MKKILASVGLVCALVTSSFANNIDVAQLNKSISDLLTPFQNNTTSASLTFNQIDIDDVKTNSLALNAHYHKQGATNLFDVNIDNLRYYIKNGNLPTASIAASIKTDITQLIPQEEINEIISQLEDFLREMADEEMSEDYGDAFSLNSEITQLNQDAKGNYRGVNVLVTTDIDLTKLPEDVSPSEVLFTHLTLSVSLDVKTGLQMHGFININPNFEMFQEDQVGLKEMLEKLVANDEEEIEVIWGIMYFCDGLASELLEGNAFSKYAIKYLKNIK